ncbi:MAG TPA: HEAT repeat domain-containing protein, partial [Thermoanaerobaculia bacterium]|nr:HEAT repeat domain-containing protein [Thermoanaerobaculia bacterium]
DSLREAAGERRPVRLGTSLACTVPVAIRGGEIVVPPRFFAELDDEQRRAGLAHELAHLRRRDPQWQLAALVLERLFPFQPLLRLARQQLRESAEYLCDEWSARQVGSPLALARCIETVAAWIPAAAAPLPDTATAMARRSSPVVRRIERLLDADGLPARRKPSPLLAALPLVAVVVAAPVVSATAIRMESAGESEASNSVVASGVWKQGDEHRGPRTVPDWTPALFERARAAMQLSRPRAPAAPLSDRWRWALDDAAQRGRRGFWIVYAFTTPTHQRDLMISDSAGTWLVDFTAAARWRGPTMLDLLDAQPAIGGDGNVVVLVHYRSAREDGFDRGVYRSARLPFDFGRTPVYWLGHAVEAESLATMDRLQARAKSTEDLRTLFIEAGSLHPTSDLVIPFLQRLLDLREPAGIRKEAAEGFDHHADPRSVRILLAVAKSDPALDVRAEAAETIGEVQVPESVRALLELVRHGEHQEIRGEAAEGLGEQPAARALPAIAELLADENVDEQALGEAVEALGSFHGEPQATKLLLDTAWHHASQYVRTEAVETLGELPGPGTVKALIDLAWRADDPQVQLEAIETLGDVHPEGDVSPEHAAREDVVNALKRIVWEHPDPEAQGEAVETLADLLGDAAVPELQRVARQHPNENVRGEARDALGEGKEHDDEVDPSDDHGDDSEDGGDTAEDG